MQETSVTLMEKMRNPREEDWERFFNLYTPYILAYARHLGMPADRANDILQEVMIVLMRKLPRFEYDPARSFRAFLKRITRYKVLKAWENDKKHRPEQLPDWEEPVAPMPTEGELLEEDAEQWKRLLTVTALRIVEKEYLGRPGNSFDIFRDRVLRGHSGGSVARRYDTNPNNVYQIRSRILARIRTVVRHLEEKGVDSVEEIPPMDPEQDNDAKGKKGKWDDGKEDGEGA